MFITVVLNFSHRFHQNNIVCHSNLFFFSLFVYFRLMKLEIPKAFNICRNCKTKKTDIQERRDTHVAHTRHKYYNINKSDKIVQIKFLESLLACSVVSRDDVVLANQ